MIHYHHLGSIPPKHHVTHREAGQLLMEQCMTRAGFNGTYSILYYRTPPTDEFRVSTMELPGFCPAEPIKEQPLHRRHIRTQDLKPAGDFLTGRRTLLMNDDLRVGVCKPTQAGQDWFSNGEGDECWFAYGGGGLVETVYGPLPFRKHDYIVIPKGTPYRLHPENDSGIFLIFESSSYVDVPSQFRNQAGQITMDAPYCHRDFRYPTELLQYDSVKHGTGPYPLIVKFGNRLSVHEYKHFPWDVVGWDGFSYPVAFNIHDYQPRTGAVHLPPTTHITFAGRGFIICSFVPRNLDYYCNGEHQAIPCPYGHASVDCDEILYYVDGHFTSRKGIELESMSLHPMGVAHGPHPGTYEKSIGVGSTGELAVMCDTFKPLRMTEAACAIEDADYNFTWVKRQHDGS